jgi:hypothetical protein
MSLPSDDLKARVLAMSREDPGPGKGTVRLRSALLMSAIGLVVYGALRAEGGIHWGGSPSRPPWFIVGTGLGWAVIAFSASWLSTRRGRSMVGRPRALLWVAALGTPILLSCWSILWNILYPETLRVCPHRIGLVCLDLVVAVASLPLLALVLWRARGDLVHPGTTGAALGAAMGAWAGFTVDLSCECTNPSHVLIGHVGPVALMVAVGFMLGRRFR